MTHRARPPDSRAPGAPLPRGHAPDTRAPTPVTRGHATERAVLERLRAALPEADGWCLYPNARWVGRTREHGPARDGETDLVVVHPERGILVVEIKDGPISADATGRWYAGGTALDESPFHQAEGSKRALLTKLRDLPGWPARDFEPRVGHAVGLPGVELASLPRGHRLLGADAPAEIVLDGAAIGTLASPSDAARAVRRAFDFWTGDGTRGRPLDSAALQLIDDLLRPTATLRPLLAHRIAEAAPELLVAERSQLFVLNTLRSRRRVAITGPAGSGKPILAAEMARRFARQGFRTLLVCFNQPLTRLFAEELADTPAPGGLVVSTFHGLCERFGRQAGSLGPKPADPPPDWFTVDLPDALDRAIDHLPGERFDAIVVDEGQDFDDRWLASLDALLVEPGEGVLWVFHDPAQALYRDDRVANLGLDEFPMHENFRNPGPIHRLAARFYHGPDEVVAWREDGLEPEIIEAAPGRPTVEAVRRVLHRLTVEEGVRPWQIAVLVGGSLASSAVWRERRFGSVVLWNANYDAAGRSLGLAADEVPEEPPDVTACDSIRRFKGLERDVIVLCELPTSGEWLDELLYVGITRAKGHLVVVGPPGPLRPNRVDVSD